MTHVAGHLGRNLPTDWQHVEKYPLRTLLPDTTDRAERTLYFARRWRTFYDQGSEGACVGFSTSQVMTILNRRRYDSRWLWDRAKEIDGYPDTNPGDDNGTTVRAAMDVLRTRGHSRVLWGKTRPENPADGIHGNRWATTVDELRTSIQKGVPAVIGTYWYKRFDEPVQKGREWFIDPANFEKTELRGGHAYMFNAVSDRRQAFRTTNSWGLDYPQVWFPYELVQRLIDMDGEVSIIADRL